MNPLTGLIPATQRKRVYAVLTLLLALYGLWQAAKGNWEQLLVSIASGAVVELARANVDTSDVDEEDAAG